MIMRTKKFVLAQHFVGLPKETDFKLIDKELPPVKSGEILVEALWLSVDPYMRLYMDRAPIGKTFVGYQIGKILESKHPDFEVGKLVVGPFGWQTRSVLSVKKSGELGLPKPYILPDFDGLPESLGLGVLGMPGISLQNGGEFPFDLCGSEYVHNRNTAYFGLLHCCQPKTGDVVAVSAAAGAVGSIVGQIAKIKGCKVIGFAGSDEKVKWIKDELGFDAGFNYKTTDVSKVLKDFGFINCYFDNVGGKLSYIIIQHMESHNGRVCRCGSISDYNFPLSFDEESRIKDLVKEKHIILKDFAVSAWKDQWFEGINQLLKWIKEGKLKYRETVTNGFENMPTAFIGMLNGENFGKAIVKA